MGRRAFLTRLALGRSAFEPLGPNAPLAAGADTHEDEEPEPRSASEGAHEAEGETIVASPKQGSILARFCDYEQQYDKKGYPENSSSKALKKRSRSAVNHVLATLGLCVAKGRDSLPTLGAYESSRLAQIRLENTCGLFIATTDKLLRLGSESWSTALRQRLQTFSFYSSIALFKIIESEWAHHGWLQFLFSGMLSSWTFFILDVEMEVLTKNTTKGLKSATEGVFMPGSRREKLKNFLIDGAGMILRLTLFVLIAPLEIHGILQRLDLIPVLPLLPDPQAYKRTFLAIFGPERGFQDLDSIIPSLWIYVFSRRNNSIRLQVHDYLWTALPKPTWPDRFSLMGAQMDGFGSSDIADLLYQNIPEGERVSPTVVDRLTSDSHSIGRNWQIFYNRYLQVLGWGDPSSRNFSIAENIVWYRALGNNTGSELARDRSFSYPPEPSTAAINTNSYGQEYPHDQQSQLSPPLQPSSPQRSRPSTPSPAPPSDTSSTLSSPPVSPRPIELTAHNDNGEVHVNLTLPAPHGTMRRTSTADAARQAAEVAISPDGTGLLENDSWLIDPVVIEQTSGPPKPIPGGSRRHGPQYCLTALSAHPAESMVQRLSSLVMSTLYLPFEAQLVRTVAIAFLSSPLRSSASEVAAARWKSEVYPPEAWFGPGLSSGRWKGAVGYVEKIILVQLLSAGVGYVTWQLGMGVVWWVGKGWCSWTKPKSNDLVLESQRVQQEWTELVRDTEIS